MGGGAGASGADPTDRLPERCRFHRPSADAVESAPLVPPAPGIRWRSHRSGAAKTVARELGRVAGIRPVEALSETEPSTSRGSAAPTPEPAAPTHPKHPTRPPEPRAADRE